VATHVVLVHPEIHWNTGNAGRTCLATGATLHLIEPLGFSLEDRALKRAGLDYWKHIDLRVWPSWSAFEVELPRFGEPYFFSTRATRVIWDAPLGEPEGVVLVFGRETGGLPAELRERYRDRFVRCRCSRRACGRSTCPRAWPSPCTKCSVSAGREPAT